jgi:hypothetical protein
MAKGAAMKIAVCLSGQPRTWRHTQASLFAFFAAHEVTTFFHTWDEVDDVELKDIVSTYSPRAFRVDSRPLFLDEKRKLAERFPHLPPLTTFDMFHSVAESLKLALAADAGGQAFDLVCRCRFDTIYNGRLGDVTAPAGAIVVQSGDYEPAEGCNDQFAIGGPEAMGLYAGISDWLPAGMEDLSGRWFRPEIALNHYLTKVCGLPLVREPFPLTLLRDDQIGRDFAELQDDLLFQAGKYEEWEAFAQDHGLEGAGALDFRHLGRTPLMLDRWLKSQPDDLREAALSADWPRRISAIDELIELELGAGPLDDQKYTLVRLICAALIHRMPRDEPMGAEAFVVHALSANTLDRTRAKAWLSEGPMRIAMVGSALGAAPRLEEAFGLVPPLEQPTSMGWRTA